MLNDVSTSQLLASGLYHHRHLQRHIFITSYRCRSISMNGHIQEKYENHI